MSVLCLQIVSVQVCSLLKHLLYPYIKELPFCRAKALSYSEGWVSTSPWYLLAQNCYGKLLSCLDMPRVKGPILIRDILMSHSGPQGLWMWLKSCQPRASVGVMQFSTNPLPCCWYLLFHSSSISDLPSALTNVACREVHPLPPRSSWWSSEAESLPEICRKMNTSPPKAKSQVHEPALVQQCVCDLNHAHSHKLGIQPQSCSCFPLMTPFNSTMVNVKIVCCWKLLVTKFLAGCSLCAVRFLVYSQFL